jgi:hypothetical protein
MGIFNRGGGPSGTPAEEDDTVIGVRGSAANKGRGKVTAERTRFGDSTVDVTWENGTKGTYAQWEVAGTNI